MPDYQNNIKPPDKSEIAGLQVEVEGISVPAEGYHRSINIIQAKGFNVFLASGQYQKNGNEELRAMAKAMLGETSLGRNITTDDERAKRIPIYYSQAGSQNRPSTLDQAFLRKGEEVTIGTGERGIGVEIRDSSYRWSIPATTKSKEPSLRIPQEPQTSGPKDAPSQAWISSGSRETAIRGDTLSGIVKRMGEKIDWNTPVILRSQSGDQLKGELKKANFLKIGDRVSLERSSDGTAKRLVVER